MDSSIEILRKNLGFDLREVAQRAGWSPGRQRAIEATGEVMADEADVLSALLGADIEALLEGEIGPKERPLGALLKSQHQALSAGARFVLAEATSVAREIQILRGLLGLPTGLGAVGRFQSNGDYGHPRHGVPAELAAKVRRALGLEGPVRSVTRDVLEPLGITLLWAPLPREVDALAFASDETGAVIVVNVHGHHTRTVYGLRIALAHEVCHLAFDRHEMTRFVRFCQIDGQLRGQHTQKFDRIERRARAFAPYLLAPRLDLDQVWHQSQGTDARRVQVVMDAFGMGYEVTRGHLDNAGCLKLGVRLQGVPTGAGPGWANAEPQASQTNPLRAGELARLAEQAVVQGHISQRRADELVRGPLAAPSPWWPEATSSDYWTTSLARPLDP